MLRLLVLPSVLAHTPSRSILLRLATFQLFELRWSSEIIDKTRQIILDRNPQLKPHDLSPIFHWMREACPHADILDEELRLQGIPSWVEGYYILAAAAAGSVNSILTLDNAHTLAEAICMPVLTVDDLLCNCWERNEFDVFQALVEQAVDLSYSVEQLFIRLLTLRRHAPRFVRKVFECAADTNRVVRLYREFGAD